MTSQPILPMYLAIDTSASMASKIGQIDSLLRGIVDELTSSPILGDRVRVAILTFSNSAELQLPLTDLAEVRALPRLRARGATAYGPIFRELARTIRRDKQLLSHRDVALYRPTIFFITDGEPVDRDWQTIYQALVDGLAPKIIALGVGDVSMEKLEQVATLKALKVGERNLERVALGLFVEYLKGQTRSVVLEDGGQFIHPDFPSMNIDDDLGDWV